MLLQVRKCKKKNKFQNVVYIKDDGIFRDFFNIFVVFFKKFLYKKKNVISVYIQRGFKKIIFFLSLSLFLLERCEFDMVINFIVIML